MSVTYLLIPRGVELEGDQILSAKVLRSIQLCLTRAREAHIDTAVAIV